MKEIWTTIHGGWGDAICNYGNIRKALVDHQADLANVVFFGLDKELISFIKAQKQIGKVRHLEMSDNSQYWQFTTLAACDFQTYTKVTGLNEKYPEIIPTHIGNYYNIQNPTLCHRYFDPVLPDPKFDWQEILPNEPFILFQPFSCHSCTFDLHWPHWIEALEFVLNNYKHKVVLIGQLTSQFDRAFSFPWIEHPNLINIVGQTPNMIDVYHIMAKAAFVITTSNALSMWSVVSNKPALVVCNKAIANVAKYYYNWIQHEPNVVLECTSTLSEFCSSFDCFTKGIV